MSYNVTRASDDRIAKFKDLETCAAITLFAERYFYRGEGRLSDAWATDSERGVNIRVHPFVQNEFDYEDEETGEIDEASFDFVTQITALRESDKTSFYVSIVIPREEGKNPEFVRAHLEVAKMSMESFSVCPCVVGIPCTRHESFSRCEA